MYRDGFACWLETPFRRWTTWANGERSTTGGLHPGTRLHSYGLDGLLMIDLFTFLFLHSYVNDYQRIAGNFRVQLAASAGVMEPVDLTDCWMPTSQAQLGCKTGYTAQKALNWFAIFNSEDGWKRWGEDPLNLYMGDFKHLNVGRGSAWVSETWGGVSRWPNSVVLWAFDMPGMGGSATSCSGWIYLEDYPTS